MRACSFMETSKSFVSYSFVTLGELQLDPPFDTYSTVMQMQSTQATVYQQTHSFPITAYFASLVGILGTSNVRPPTAWMSLLSIL